MSKKAFINGRILTPQGMKDNHTIIFQEDKIVLVCQDIDRPTDIAIERDLDGLTILPGFIDLQVNGGGGVLFNDSPCVDGIKQIGAAHRQFGTTGFFPTLISDDLDIMAQAIRAVDLAIEQGVPGVLGIHLEGPFLNLAKRGVHDETKLKQISERDLELVSSLRGGKTLLTLAPEQTTLAIIRDLRKRGVVVAAGHTQASYEETLSALDAGLTGFTHLFNAMPQLSSRDPGIIGAALEDDRAWCGIIADGHHVHPAILRLARRAKREDQLFLVTDAMPCVGSNDKVFSLGTEEIRVVDGKCVTAQGVLAGSDLDMIGAICNAIEMMDVDMAQAVRMASIVPANFMNMQGQVGEIRAGLQANFVIASSQLEIQEVWIDGKSG